MSAALLPPVRPEPALRGMPAARQATYNLLPYRMFPRERSLLWAAPARAPPLLSVPMAEPVATAAGFPSPLAAISQQEISIHMAGKVAAPPRKALEELVAVAVP